MKVALTPDDIALCTKYATLRADMHERHGIGHRRADRVRTNHQCHMAGIAPEYAFAKLRGLVAEWEATAAFVDSYAAIRRVRADVGDKYQVRSTTLPHGNLLFHERKDDPAQVYVLGRYDEATQVVTFVGWAYGHECLYPENRNTRNRRCTASHIVPADTLHPMETLP